MATLAENTPRTKRRSWLKRRMPKTLFGRALVIFLTSLILMQAISTYVFYDRHWDTMVRRLATSLAGDIALIVTEVETDSSPAALARIDRLSRNHLGLVITYRSGAILENRGTVTLFDPTLQQMRRSMTEQVRRPYMIDTEAGLRYLLTSWASLNVKAELDYLNSSDDTGYRDTRYTMGLGVGW